MGDGKSADSIQIEIEASSADAEKKVNALSDALERLKRASTGYGDISGKIRDIGESARCAAGSKTRKRRDALDRAVAQTKQTETPSINALKISREMRSLDSEIERAKNTTAELERQLSILSNIKGSDAYTDQISALNRQLLEQKTILDGLISKREQLSSTLMNGAGEAADSKKEIVESEDSLQKKLGIIQRISDTISNIAEKKIDIGSASGLKDLLSKDLSMQNLAPKGASAALDALKNSVGGLNDKLMSFASKHPVVAGALVGLKSAAQTAWNAFKSLGKISLKGFEVAAKSVNKLASSLLGLGGRAVKSAVSGLKSLAKSIGSRFTTPFRKAIEQVSKWKQMLGSALFYSTVFKAMSLLSASIKEGVDSLYQYSKIVGTDFAPAMDKLATSALYLKNSIGAMAAPLIEAVAPAVDFLVDKFVELLNVVGKTFAALTGKDVYSQARKHAVEYAESAEEAKKETEDFKKFLLGIDELNIMPSQDDGADAAKNPLEDYSSMFEEVQVPVEQMDWADQIREAIENGDWYSVGRIVAEKLNEIVDGWDAYAWGRKLGELITKGLNIAFGFLENFNFETLGSKLAGWLNGIFDGIDWDVLGRTFAEKWNALFDFIYGFATTLNWTGIGLDIATAINGFLDQLDPSKAAAAVNEFILGIFRMLNTAITETHWDEIGTKLAQFINEIDWAGIVYNGMMVIVNGLDAVKELVDAFLDEWDWKTMADEIASGINASFSQIDPEGWGETLGNLFRTAFNFVRELVSKIQWGEIGEDISQFIQGINLQETADVFLDMVGELVNGVITGVKAFLAETPDEVLADLTEIIGAIALGAVALMSKSKTVLIAEGIAILISVFAEFGEEIKTLAGQLAEDFNGLFASIDWLEVGKFIGDGIINILDTIITLIDEIDWGAIAHGIVELLAGVDWVSLAVSIVDGIMSLLGAASESVVSLITDMPQLLLIGAEIIGAILAGIVNAVLDLPGWLVEHVITPFIDGLKRLPESFLKIGEDIMNSLLEGFKKAFSGIMDFLNDALDFVSNIWNTITGKTSEASNSASGFGGKRNSSAFSMRQEDVFSELRNVPAPKAYASGGFPGTGEMFIAREAGPELVGKIGQKNTVANNDQITTGIADGVRDANTDVVNAVYAMANMIVKAVEDKETDINLDGQSLARGIQPYQKRLSSLQGVSLVD